MSTTTQTQCSNCKEVQTNPNAKFCRKCGTLIASNPSSSLMSSQPLNPGARGVRTKTITEKPAIPPQPLPPTPTTTSSNNNSSSSTNPTPSNNNLPPLKTPTGEAARNRSRTVDGSKEPGKDTLPAVTKPPTLHKPPQTPLPPPPKQATQPPAKTSTPNSTPTTTTSAPVRTSVTVPVATNTPVEATPDAKPEPEATPSVGNDAELEARWLAAEARIKELEAKLRDVTFSIQDTEKLLEDAKAGYAAPQTEEEMGGAPPPPPPPGPPPPPPPPALPAVTGARADLMASIRGGAKLKKVKKPEEKTPEDKAKEQKAKLEKQQSDGSIFSLGEIAASMAKQKGSLEKKIEIAKSKSEARINLDPELNKKLSMRNMKIEKKPGGGVEIVHDEKK